MKEELIKSKIAAYKRFLDEGQEESIGGSFAERQERVAYYGSLSKERILSFTEEELRTFINGFWAKRLADDATEIFKTTSPEKVKTAIAEFIFGEGTVQERWDAMKVHKIGRGRKAEMLAFAHPETCVNCDSKDVEQIMAFEPGIKTPSQGMTGAEYVEYCSVVERIRQLLEEAGCPASNLVEADRFLYFLAVTDPIKKEDKPIEKKRKGNRFSHWFISCQAEAWDPSKKEVGTEESFTGQYKECFESAKINDTVVFYVNRSVVALGIVIGELTNKEVRVRLTERLGRFVSLEELKANPSTASCRYLKRPRFTTMSELTDAEYQAIIDMSEGHTETQVDVRPPYEASKIGAKQYTEDDFLNDVFMTSDDLSCLRELLERKKNIILQGPPGVGKSYAAKKIAYVINGNVDEDKIRLVQFHQSYSYEDFIQGYKPNEDGGFSLVPGVFYDFCLKAQNDPNSKYFFIIDEINRGNISKIFGELLMLIEATYRGPEHAVKLAYQKTSESFYIPSNLYIIGLMNTADRSLALIDYALRRRFAFITIEPAFERGNPAFESYKAKLNWYRFNKVISVVSDLNEEIADDESLGEGFKIGHSYFCGFEGTNDEALKGTVLYEIIPMIEEYWNDEPDKRIEWVGRLKKALE